MESRPDRVRPPRQARSRATLERLFQATAELLTARRFEEATVAEMVRACTPYAHEVLVVVARVTAAPA